MADPDENDEKKPIDPRVAATSAISGSTIAILGVCIPLVAILKSPLIVFFALGGAALAIAGVWYSGRSKEVASKSKEIAALSATVEELKARLDDVEVINRFETTLAERALEEQRSELEAGEAELGESNGKISH
ncbi:MAG: hypothetical protein ACR2RV_21455 [Verrucomicrobiales bacterium]